MEKHKIERTVPAVCRVPENIPEISKFRCIVADPPWCKNQCSAGGYGGALGHYDLMSLDRIKSMPVKDLADENAHLWLWATDSNIDDALAVVKAWGFRYITMFHWFKPKMGVGNYLRGASEPCIFAVRGKLPPMCRTQINWILSYPTIHSEKPREIISAIERVSPGPRLELFCRKRPASSEKWYCWGNEVQASHYEPAGADIFIPGYPVPKYSFEHNDEAAEQPVGKSDEAKEEV